VHRASLSRGQEAFLEGHVYALERLGGVPRDKIRYDNLKPEVSRVLFGRSRQETERSVTFRSHFGFEPFYCQPGHEGSHEKGGVEGEGGRFRRNHCVPMPVVDFAAGRDDLVRVDPLRGNRAYVSGHGPLAPDGSPSGPYGKVPSEVPLEAAQQSARLTALAVIAGLKTAIGDLDRIAGWAVVNGFVNADPGYAQTTLVLNPFSDLILDVFGPEVGAHARTAIGVPTCRSTCHSSSPPRLSCRRRTRCRPADRVGHRSWTLSACARDRRSACEYVRLAEGAISR
jgi:enamine deaminase RidA (YjgF/YER057c/UK114 family)